MLTWQTLAKMLCAHPTLSSPAPPSGYTKSCGRDGFMPLDSNNYRGVPLESPDPGMHITEGCLMTEISELSLEREKKECQQAEGGGWVQQRGLHEQISGSQQKTVRIM